MECTIAHPNLEHYFVKKKANRKQTKANKYKVCQHNNRLVMKLVEKHQSKDYMQIGL